MKRIISTALLSVLVSLILLILFIAGGMTWDQYQVKRQAQTLVQELEEYRIIHQKYPDDLSPFLKYTATEVSYIPDSTRQSFTLSYISGIIKNHLVQYNSTIHKWGKVF